ncbi:hypothetical protein H8356DRAFT_1734864 [Neocallimastix lanati (nom. inval.)]|nr:hypothetical protein H8356DRAFT_1734864 [Neocallimastix sp. JGI-2020a]
MKNEEMLSRIRELGINELKEKYKLLERPIQPKFKNLTINGMGFNINQYEIIGVGNFAIMDCSTPFFQMITCILTSFYKDLPLLSFDYILKGDKRQSIIEVDSLVTDKNNEMHKECIKKFKENLDSLKLEENEVKPCWYDDIKEASIDKTGSEADDDAILNLLKNMIQTFKEYEQKYDYLDIDKRVKKYNITREYTTNLVEKGGISTNMFKIAIGEDTTKEFYYTILFGTDCFKPNY